MARPRKFAAERATHHLHFRLTEAQYRALETLAGTADQSVGTFARATLLEALGLGARPPPVSSADQEALALLVSELNVLTERLRFTGRTLNRIAREIHTAGRLSEDLEPLREALEENAHITLALPCPAPAASPHLSAAVDALLFQLRRIRNNLDQLVPELAAQTHPALAQWQGLRAQIVRAADHAGGLAGPSQFWRGDAR